MLDLITALIIDKNNAGRTGCLRTAYPDWMENTINVIWRTDDADAKEILSSSRVVDAIVTIGGVWEDYPVLAALPYDTRKRWVHFADPVPDGKLVETVVSVFSNNLGDKSRLPLFSIITPTYKSKKAWLDRLFSSLKAQSYDNWEWVVLDDTPDTSVTDTLDAYADPRITVFKNHSHHGKVGFNKRMLGMVSNGDYVVEVDHDDELTANALGMLKSSFERHPDAGFAYSLCLELIGENMAVDYGDNWGYGQGGRKWEWVNGLNYLIMDTPGINAKSIRGIYGAPNHVRAWRKDVYCALNGHNPTLAIVDDYELIVRTFLETRMVKIPTTLYIQHREEETTQDKRFKEIQRVNHIVAQRYDADIHRRLLELGSPDEIWCEYVHRSDVGIPTGKLFDVNYVM